MRMLRFIITALLLGVAGVATSQTGCVPEALPWSEGFDSYGSGATLMPPCWAASHNYDLGAVPHVDTSVHFDGTASLMLYSGTLTGSHYSMAIGPEVDADLSSGIYARFHFYAPSTSVALEVGICDDTNRYTRNFVPLDTIHADQGRRWKEVVVDLGAYTGTGRRLAFRLQRALQAEASQCYIDNLRLEGCGTLLPRVYHLGHNSLTVEWERFGVGAVSLEYNGMTVDNAVSPLTLTGLTPATTYTLSLGCAGGMRQEVSATTLPGPSLTTTYRMNDTTLHVAGDSSLAVLPLPLDDIEIAQLALTFLLQGDGSTTLAVGVMDYAGEAESFVAIESMTVGQSLQRHTVSLASYSGTGRYIALMATGEGTVNLGSLRLAHCLIDSVRLYDLTDLSVSVAWDTLAPATGSEVTIEYGPHGFAAGSGTVVTATQNPFVLNGLEASTSYDLIVAPACGDSPLPSDRHTITTFLHEVSTPYCMTFEEDGTLPQGWVCGQGSATLGANAYEGLRSLHLAAQSLVTLPRMDSDGDTVVMEFYGYGSGSLEVGFMANPFGTFVSAATLTGGSGWQRHVATLVVPEGRLVALRSTTAWDLDALAVHHDAVTAAVADAIGKTTAHLSWQTLRGDSVEVEYSAVASATADFTPGTGTTVRGLDSLTLSGLTPGTFYAVHLWPIGDAGECRYQTCRLQTAAADIDAPYCENFDALNALPSSWRRKSDFGEYPIVSTERNRSPDKSLRFSATATKKTIALLPDFVSNSEHLTLAFWTNVTMNPTGAMLIVGQMDDIADMASFVPIDTLLFSQTEQWQHHRTVLGNLHEHVVLMLVGGSSSETRLFLDDLCVEPCLVDRVTVGIDSTSLTFNWESHGAALDISITGDDFTVRDTFATSPAVIGGLAPDMPYIVRLRAVCDCGGNGGVYLASNGTDGSLPDDHQESFSFNTQEGVRATPYCNDFEYTTGYTPFYWSHPRNAVSDRNYHHGSHSLLVKDSSYVVLPRMENVSTLTVSLHVYASNESGLGEGVILLGVLRAPDTLASFTPVDTLVLTRPGEWQRLWGDMRGYDGSGEYITLKIKSTDTCTFFLDNLNVSPCAIGAAEVDEGGVVEWESLHTPTKVAIEYGSQGFPQGSGHRDTATASPYTLQNLTAGENYDIYLTPICGEATSCDAVKVTLGAAASTPYCEHFESAPPAGMPTGWSMGRTYGGTPSIATGDNQRLSLRGHAAVTHRSIAVLPLLSSHDTLQLSMSLHAEGLNSRLAIGHIATNADPNTFVATDTLVPTVANSWQRLSSIVDLPAGRRLAASCFSVNQSDAQVQIDSLAVTRGLSPTLSATSARTLTIGGTTGFVEYGPQGFIQGNGTTARLTADGLTIEGLTPENEYWIYTREDSLTLTCMPPAKLRMPAEAALPYCLGDTLFSLLQLPEMAIDSLRHLHLHITADGYCQLEVGVMDGDGDWEHLVAVDTFTVADGIRQTAHIALERYTGNGRFVGLRSLTGNATIRSLTATTCSWPTLEGGDDNSVLLVGTGDMEYGPEGFVPGNGTVASIVDSLRIPLAANSRYDFYSLCSGDTPCYHPLQWESSSEVELPYCITFENTLPTGWTTFTNAPGSNAIHLADGALALTAAPHRVVEVKLPIMQEHSVVVDMEILLSGNDVHLLLGADTVAATAGTWETVRVRAVHGGRLTLRATGDGTVRLRNLSVNTCALPRELTIGQPGGRGVELSWDTSDADNPFFVEYRPAGSTAGVAVRASEPPLTLHLLPDTSYTLFLLCDSLGTTCREPLTITTLSDPLPLPYCTSFNINSPSYTPPEEWYTVESDRRTYLVMPQFNVATLQSINILIIARMQHLGQSMTLGAMSDAGDPETFDSLVTFRAEDGDGGRFFHSLANYYGNGRFLALRIDSEGSMVIDHLSVDTCAAYNFAMTETETDHIVIEWEQQGSPTVTVEYGPVGFNEGQGTMVTATTSPLLIDSLAPLTDYAFLVSSHCDEMSCRVALVDSFLTFIPKGGTGCIDYTDLHASYVSCKYGSYSNPTEFTGVIDRGYMSAASRHTVHFDTTEHDARTGNLLRTVPPGEQASVRLGNWSSNINPQAESITYALTVDTNDFSLLVLRYAAVLQDPEHSADLQPRFRLQILNQNNEVIDACSAADFIANPSLNWNIAPNDVLWKDWTTVGVDLTPYAGQTIFIRLITNDCGEGSHFGYAYFTLGCSSKRMRSEGCSYVPNNRFTVPSGFNYQWYSNLDTTIISDSSSIWVPSDNNLIYFCQLSFIDNPECHFTMSAFAGARFPLAIIDTSLALADCAFDLTLIDHSTISGDGFTPIGTGESCETSLWLLPDSTTSDAPTLTLHLTDTGSYDIGLVAGIADNQCLDTVHHTIHITYPYPAVTLDGRNERCLDDPAEVLALANAAHSDWEGHLLALTPLADTTVTVSATDSNGCLHSFTHTLIVHPVFHIEDSVAVCSSNLSHTWRDTTLSFTIADSALSATLHRQTTYGCDSTMTLALTLWPSYDIHHTDTLCDNQTLDFFDTVLNTTGDYLHSDATTHGCDSLVTMDLNVMPTYLVPDSLVACDSLRWQDGTLYTADTMGALHVLPSIHGCDSTIELHLTIHPSYHQQYRDSVCNSLDTYVWLDTLLTLDPSLDDITATLVRHTVHACDSIHTLELTLMPTYDVHLHDTLCHDSQIPFFDTILTSTGDYLHSGTTTFGCDSLVTMHLEIVPRLFGNDTLVVCDSMTWINSITYYRDTAGVSDTLLSLRGCDSVRTLYLTVNQSTYELTVDTFCNGSQYQFRDHIFTNSVSFADTIPTVKGCDSVMALDLTRLEIPQLSISYDYDCDSLHYHLNVHSDVPYLLWTSTPYDNLIDGHEHDSLFTAYPKTNTTYTLYADYAADPHCPVTTTLSLSPAQKPIAKMRVNPSALVLPENELDAYDNSAEYAERAWYVNGIIQAETSRHLHLVVPTDRDTVELALVLSDHHCDDTALALIPLLYSTLAAPNAFTPDRDNNNLFLIQGIGIIQAEVRIYNRHGMLVFHTTDINQPWDGRNIAGEPCPTGNYVWHLRYTSVTRPGAFREESGTVLLIR